MGVIVQLELLEILTTLFPSNSTHCCVFVNRFQWLIYIDKFLMRGPLLGLIFFIFIQFSGNFVPLGLAFPLENPGPVVDHFFCSPNCRSLLEFITGGRVHT